MIKGRNHEISKTDIFGSAYYAYKNLKKKQDPKDEKGIFVGRQKQSFTVFLIRRIKVLKQILDEFVSSMTNKQTQTYPTNHGNDAEDFYPKKFRQIGNLMKLLTHKSKYLIHLPTYRSRKIVNFGITQEGVEYVC